MGAAAGALLRRWREGALLTQEELGRRAGVDARTVRRLEAGELRRPRRSTLRLLTEALDVDETGRAELRAALAGGGSEPAPAGTPTTAPPPPRELPACRGELVGRSPELDHLLAAREQGGGVWAVEGMPGIGKSFFALRAARAVAHDYPDGHYFVDLQAARRRRTAPSDVLGRLLRASGVPGETVPGDVDEGAALFRSVTAGRRVLLVLDGAQELAEVEPLLPGAEPSLVVVTSRRRLVGLERTRTVVLGPVPAPAAVRLLAEAAEAPGLASDPAAAETVDLCGRIPLALQLVGSRLRSRPAWSLADLNDRLRSGARLDELDPGGRDMAAALSASVEQLAPRERRAYKLAGHAPDPVLGPEAAAALFGVPTSEARTVLAELVECHLVEEPAPDRFTMHALVCEHARRDRPDDADDAVRRLLDHHLVSVRAAVSVTRAGAPGAAAAPHVPTGRLSARSWLDRELEGVLAGVVPARRLGRGDVVLELSALLERHLDTTGRHRAAFGLHRVAAEEAHARRDPEAESLALSRAARVLDQHGAPQEALETYRHALELARPGGSPLATGTALLGIGNRLRLQNDYDAALLVLAEAEGLARSSALRPLRAEVLVCLGHVHRQMRDDVHAVARFEEALAMASRPRDPQVQSDALLGLGWIRHVHRDLAEAELLFERALEVALAEGRLLGEAAARLGLGHVQLLTGEREAATGSFEAVLSLAERLASDNWRFEALLGLTLAWLEHEPAVAVDLGGRAVAAARPIGPFDRARAHDVLGDALAATGRSASAVEHWQCALDVLDGLPVDELADELADGELSAASVVEKVRRHACATGLSS